VLEQVKAFLAAWMDPQLVELAGKVYWGVVAPLFAQPTIHWAFISCSLVAAAAYYYACVARNGERSLTGCFRYIFPKAIYAHPSAVLDYKYYVVTQFVFRYLPIGKFVAGLAAVLYVSEGMRWLLEAVFGESTHRGAPGWNAIAVYTLVVTLAYDFARWFGHYLHHRIPVLWEFHKVHHSAEVLTPISSFRAHPVDQAIEFFLRTVAVSAVSAVFGYFYPVGITMVTIMGFGAISFIFHLVGHLRHSHVPFSFGPFDRVFVSPHMHQLHHSAQREHYDKNFGFIFSLWDQLAGTLYIPRQDEKFILGLPDEAEKYRTVRQLYFQPFIGAARLLFGEKPQRALS
jgi:Sterol desaturase